MARSISLSYTPQKVADQSYAYTLVATGTNTPSEIFVILQRPANAANPSGNPLATFDHIATPTDLLNVGIGTPLPGSLYYRTATVVLTYNTRDLADDALTLITGDITALIDALNAGDETLATQTVDITG
jgi:hypothetical protein